MHGSIVGMAVDYLTRFMLGESPETVFSISLIGASRAQNEHFRDGYYDAAQSFVAQLDRKLDDKTIECACKLSTFDVWFRNASQAIGCKDYTQTNPDVNTIQNIRIMVERSMSFWGKYGPIEKTGFTFRTVEDDTLEEPNTPQELMRFLKKIKETMGGYTDTVITGDGDYLTKDTIWEFKVLRSKPDKNVTLQLLMYWIMGQHSERPEFKGVDKVGIFNPRLNTIYILDINNVPRSTIKEIEEKVICY
ncbi:MAG: hypothetical protein IJ740_17095 [Ruminococcus sp.]|nr:hypothetical protein [Ruminococcus sp.]